MGEDPVAWRTVSRLEEELETLSAYVDLNSLSPARKKSDGDLQILHALFQPFKARIWQDIHMFGQACNNRAYTSAIATSRHR